MDIQLLVQLQEQLIHSAKAIGDQLEPVDLEASSSKNVEERLEVGPPFNRPVSGCFPIRKASPDGQKLPSSPASGPVQQLFRFSSLLGA